MVRFIHAGQHLFCVILQRGISVVLFICHTGTEEADRWLDLSRTTDKVELSLGKETGLSAYLKSALRLHISSIVLKTYNKIL